MPLRKYRYIIITILVTILIALLLFPITQDKPAEKVTTNNVKILGFTPEEGSEVLASKGHYNIKIKFNTEAAAIIESVEIKDNFGLNWEKKIYDKDIISFSTKFGKGIMSQKELEINLFYNKELLRRWVYKIPLDENITGPLVTPTIEKDATFVPSEEDIEYFAELQRIVDQEQPLWRLLPYETEKFRVSHYIDTLTLVVYTKEGRSKLEVEPLIRNWISKNGGDAEEHKIEWR